MALSPAHSATKVLLVKPYKDIVVQRLQEANCAVHVHFCNCFCTPTYRGKVPSLPNYFVDEASFYLNGHAHTKNKLYWATDNISLIHKLPLNEIKPGIWCAISATRILGPTLF